jgi:hypothetical protein
VLLFFVEHAQPLHAREGVLLSGRQGVPRSVMEGQQGRGKDQGQDEWVPRDLEPRSWQVGGVGIAVLQQIVHGRKFLPFLHHWCFRSGGGFVVFGLFSGHGFNRNVGIGDIASTLVSVYGR